MEIKKRFESRDYLKIYSFLVIFLIILIASVSAVSIKWYKPSGAPLATKTCTDTRTAAADGIDLTCTNTTASFDCSEEGNYYAEFDLTEEGVLVKDCRSDPNPFTCSITADGYGRLQVKTWTINWDNNQADCECRVGAGRFLLVAQFATGLSPRCCGDEPATEFFISATAPKNIDEIDFCCKASTAYVVNGGCCEDDPNEYYAGPSNGKSCDGTSACCSVSGQYSLSGSCVSACVSELHWEDMHHTPINKTDFNDRVKLTAEGLGLKGTTIEYELWEVGGTASLWSAEKVTPYASVGFYEWVANQSGKFYFKAKVKGSTQNLVSSENNPPYGVLSVSSQTNEHNTPPVANITSPKIRDIYFTSEYVEFNQTSYDVDDFIDYTWTLGDGSTRKGSTRDYVDYSFLYKYNSSGQMTINLSVVDERGLTASDRTSILVLSAITAGRYVVAGIEKPKWGDRIEGYDVLFNASLSYALETTNCNGVSCEVYCLGGRCPATTHGGILINNSNNKRGNYSDLNFSWSFDDNSTYKARGALGVWLYKTLGYTGTHWAKLTTYLSDSIIPSGSTETQFSNYITEKCVVDLQSGGKWVWWDENGTAHYPLTEPGVCLGKDGVPESIDDCCPSGYACQIPEDAPDPTDPMYAICQVSGEDYCVNIFVCDDYASQAECQNDTCKRGELQPGSTCGGTVTVSNICGFQYFTSVENECKCGWNETLGKCFHVQGLKSTIYQDIQVVHSCRDRIEHGECVDGLMNIKKTSELILDPSIIIPDVDKAMCKEKLCPAYEGTIMCGRPLIKLFFFSLKNLIIAAVIIIIIYIILVSRKKKGKAIAERKARKKKL